MSNDYAYQLLAEQKLQDFRAEAANDRLARIARAGQSTGDRGQRGRHHVTRHLHRSNLRPVG